MVSPWILRSQELANGRGYLDSLSAVYPLLIGGPRDLGVELLQPIQRAHRARDGVALITELLRLERFPIDFPYAAMLKSNPALVATNPETVERIARPLLEMEWPRLMTLCSLPKPANTQMGPMFQRFVQRLGYPVLEEEEFEMHDGVAFLAGGDRDLQIYANRPDGLDCSLRKGLDFLFKTPRGHFIGEAKFFSSTGGNQNHAFDEALDFLGQHRGQATRLVVLDGVVWFNNMRQRMQREIQRQDATALSALLLRNYVESVS